MSTAIDCLVLIARQRGVETTATRLIHDYAIAGEPDDRRLLRIAADLGLKGVAKQFAWGDLHRLGSALPVLLRLRNGNCVLVAGAQPATDDEPAHIQVLDPLADRAELLRIRKDELEKAWDGRALLLKRDRRVADEDQPFGLRWFIPQILRHRLIVTEVAIIAFLLHAVALTVPVFIQIVLDKVVGNQSLQTLHVLAFGVAIALIFEAALGWLRSALLLHVTSKIDVRVSTRVFSRLIALPIDFFRASSAGALTKKIEQTASIREFLTGKLLLTVLDATALFIFIPVLFFYSPLLTAVVLIFTFLICCVTFVVRRSYKEKLQELYRTEGERQAMLVETLSGMETVKALALEPGRTREWNDASASVVRTNLEVAKTSNTVRHATQFLQKLMTVAVIWLGTQEILDGTLSVGAIIAFNMLAARVSGPITQLAGLAHEFQQTGLSVAMVAEILNQKPERKGSGGLTPKIRGAIEFENVGFRYGLDSPPALQDCEFRARAGEVVGIVGRSGSGKSTIARLIQGLYPAMSGVIRIDGIDIREIDLAHLRLSLGVVLQESYLFRGTIRDNIALTQSSAAFDDIVAAAQLAGADQFIQRLPQGFDTMLEERGGNLSGGQRQRLALARALLRDPRILILDESTSALDPESEAVIQRNMPMIAAGRTVLVISHRLTTLTTADKILVVERGGIAAAGPHEEMLAASRSYAEMWRTQTRVGDAAPAGGGG